MGKPAIESEKPATAPPLKEEKAAPVKKEPIKAEQSPGSSPSKLSKVKKEYALPGQTRDTPEEVGLCGKIV